MGVAMTHRLALAVCLTSLAVAVMIGRAVAQPATSLSGAVQLTLAEAITQALARNRDLRVSRLDIEVSRGRLQQAQRYPFNPELSLGGSGGRVTAREEDGGQRTGVSGGVIGLSQVVEIRGQRGVRMRGARADVLRAEWTARETERTVIADVTRAFAELLVAQERSTLARQTLALAERLRSTAKALVDAGDVPELDLLRADVEVRRAENRLRLDEAAAAAAIRTLALLIGARADVGLTATGPLLLEPVPGTLDELLDRARAGRPDLKAAEAAVEGARAGLRLTRTESFFPYVTVSGGYSEGVDVDGRGRTALLGVSIPLPFWNRREGDITAAAAQLAKQQADHERLLAQIDKEVTTAFRQFATAQQVLQVSLGQILPAQEQNTRLLEEGYRRGQLRLTEALLAQRDLIEGRIAYLDALANYNATRTDLLKAADVRP